MPKTILAIDPGTTESGWCKIDVADMSDAHSIRPIDFWKSNNRYVLGKISGNDIVVIEKLVSYGNRIGNEVLETCEWVGRFTQRAEDLGIPVYFVKRIDEKRQICGTPTANDSMIRNALIAEFATHDKKTGKGTKSNPDYFYGFKADVWQAFAVGVTYLKGRE